MAGRHLLVMIYFRIVSEFHVSVISTNGCTLINVQYGIVVLLQRTCVTTCIVGIAVKGVAQLRNIVYVVCFGFSSIRRFNAVTHQRLKDIIVKDFKSPWDVVACEQTCQVYVADWQDCVWRVSADGADVKRWWPKSSSDTFTPYSLSVMSTRLLVTSYDTNQLIHLDAVGDELRRVQLQDDMELHHAVETPAGTFIVSHNNPQLNQCQVSEVNTDAEVLRQFSGLRLRTFLSLPTVNFPPHVAVDSRGNIFVADRYYRRILLLDAQLTLRRVIIDDDQLNYKPPCRMCYREQSGQLLVGCADRVAVFDVLHR